MHTPGGGGRHGPRGGVTLTAPPTPSYCGGRVSCSSRQCQFHNEQRTTLPTHWLSLSPSQLSLVLPPPHLHRCFSITSSAARATMEMYKSCRRSNSLQQQSCRPGQNNAYSSTRLLPVAFDSIPCQAFKPASHTTGPFACRDFTEIACTFAACQLHTHHEPEKTTAVRSQHIYMYVYCLHQVG